MTNWIKLYPLVNLVVAFGAFDVSCFSWLQQVRTTDSSVPFPSSTREDRGGVVEGNGYFERRQFFGTVSSSASAILGAGIAATGAPAHAAVLQTGQCASGYGEGCEDLAGDNEFIKSLQKRSADNRERYAMEALDAYNMKNYPDVFAAMNPPRYLVRNLDGTYIALTADKVAELQSAGKIRLETPMAMGGKVTDLTQKPIRVMVE